ncbi:restriction endonuclease subunit S [Psychrobacter celer]
MVPSGWKLTTVSEVFDIQLGKMLNQKAKTEQPQYPYLGNSNVKWGDFDLTELKTMYFSDKETIKFELKPNDILMCEGGEVGRCAIWQDSNTNIYYQKALHRLRVRGDISPIYFQNYMQSISGTKLLEDYSSRTSIAHLTKEKLSSLPLKLPPLPEQQKIAKILTTWDKAISTTERLIDNSKQQKKALMQQLLTGKKRLLDDNGKRFEGEWEEVQLGELAFIDKKSLGKSTPDDFEFKYISLSDVSEGVISNSTETYVYESAPSRARRIISENDVLLSTVRPNLKGFAKAKAEHDGFVASTGFSVITAKKQASSDYIYHYVFGEHITRQIYALVVGSNYPAINSSEVSKLKILKPSLEEQQKIATVLTNADKEIDLLEQQLTDLQQEKKALMQVLLTGKKRVRIDGGVYL